MEQDHLHRRVPRSDRTCALPIHECLASPLAVQHDAVLVRERAARELRIERGMTLDELARAANISASHLSRLERGQTAPSFKVAADIARHIGVKPSDLATIQREQSDVDSALIEALTARGLSEPIAQHICDKISTVARAALLEILK